MVKCSGCGLDGHNKNSASCPAKNSELIRQIANQEIRKATVTVDEEGLTLQCDRQLYELSKHAYSQKRKRMVEGGHLILTISWFAMMKENLDLMFEIF